jgi:hypothetical protein
VKFCTACGASIAAEIRFCGNCGAAVTLPENGASVSSEFGVFEPELYDVKSAVKSNWLTWFGLGAVLALGLLYYFIFIYDDRSNDGGTPTAGEPQAQIVAPKTAQLFASTIANIRNKPTMEGSEIVGKLKRGDTVGGRLVPGSADGEFWLELEGGKGFVSLVNLSETEAPALTTSFGQKTILLVGPADMWNAPSQDAQLLDRLSKGLSISASGITENGYLEIILKKGGVGYIADGKKIVADAELADIDPPILVKLDNDGCAIGPEITALFKRMADAKAAGLKMVENASYPSDDARDAALDKYYGRIDGKTSFMRLKRSFNGLTVTGIAQHYESQSVYFDDPPEKVRSVFRGQGYKVGKDGKLPSNDIYAGIYAAPREFSAFGKTDLGCGV